MKLTYKFSHYSFLLSQYSAVALAFFIPISTSLMQVFLITTAFFALCAGQWRKQYMAVISNPIALILLAFFSLFLIGLFYTSASLSASLNMVMKYHRYVLVLFLFYILADEKIRRFALYAFMLAVSATLFLSYLKFFTMINWFNNNIPATDPAVFKNHIETSFIFAIAAYFSALFSIKDTQKRWFWAILCVFIVINLFYINQGRSGQVVFIPLAVLLGWQFLRWRGICIAVILSIALIGSASILSTGFKMRVEAAKQDTQQLKQGEVDTSLGLRVEFVKNCLKIIKAHPLLGAGTGSLAAEYAKVASSQKYMTSNPHNEYINMAVQFGILGLFVLFMMFYLQWRYSYKLSHDMRCIAQSVIVVIAVGCLANSWLMDVTEGYFYVYFIALTFANLKKGYFNEIV